MIFHSMQAAKNLREDQRCVVILADSVRNYMTKFLDDDWMEEREFVRKPVGGDGTADDEPWWKDHPISRLKLETPLTIAPTMKCQSAIEIMNRTQVSDQTIDINEVKHLTLPTVIKGGLNSWEGLENILKNHKSGGGAK